MTDYRFYLIWTLLYLAAMALVLWGSNEMMMRRFESVVSYPMPVVSKSKEQWV